MDESLIRLPEVKARTGLSRSSIYQFIRDGMFPSPVKLSPRAVAWVSSEIQAWLEARIAASRKPVVLARAAGARGSRRLPMQSPRDPVEVAS